MMVRKLVSFSVIAIAAAASIATSQPENPFFERSLELDDIILSDAEPEREVKVTAVYPLYDLAEDELRGHRFEAIYTLDANSDSTAQIEVEQSSENGVSRGTFAVAETFDVELTTATDFKPVCDDNICTFISRIRVRRAQPSGNVILHMSARVFVSYSYEVDVEAKTPTAEDLSLTLSR
jgi:hypothetical protein